MRTILQVSVLVLGLGAAGAARADVAPGGCGCARERRQYVVPECEGKANGDACGASPGSICRSFGPHTVCVAPNAPPDAGLAAEADAGVRGMSVPPVWVAAVGLWALARRRLRR